MMSILGTVALGFAAYHLLAHLSTLLRKEPPSVQRTRLGFGLALLSDLGAYGLALSFVCTRANWPWYWPALALGFLMHSAYVGMFVNDQIYRRIHHYENPDIFSDGQFVSPKWLLLTVDTAGHFAAVWAIGTAVSPEGASFAFVVAASIFAILWAKRAAALKPALSRS